MAEYKPTRIIGEGYGEVHASGNKPLPVMTSLYKIYLCEKSLL
jgi:hypothetical protein